MYCQKPNFDHLSAIEYIHFFYNCLQRQHLAMFDSRVSLIYKLMNTTCRNVLLTQFDWFIHSIIIYMVQEVPIKYFIICIYLHANDVWHGCSLKGIFNQENVQCIYNSLIFLTFYYYCYCYFIHLRWKPRLLRLKTYISSQYFLFYVLHRHSKLCHSL